MELVERGGRAAGTPAVVVVEATATVVSLDAAYKPRRIPAGVRAALAAWSETGGGDGGRGGGALSWDSD